MHRRNDIKKIVKYYGLEHQINIWIEEMSELTKELCKLRRNYYEPEYIEHVKEEMVDVGICLDQIKYAFGVSKKWEKKYRNYKLNRQRKRIKKGEE